MRKRAARPPAWARQCLEAAPRFVPAGHPVQLILDVLDYPDSLLATAEAAPTSWGVQLFGGAEVFADPERAAIFARAVEQMRLHLSKEERA